MAFAVTPAPAPDPGDFAVAAAPAQTATGDLPPPWLRFMEEGVELGDGPAVVWDFVGDPGAVTVTRGVGENAHVITVRLNPGACPPIDVSVADGGNPVGSYNAPITYCAAFGYVAHTSSVGSGKFNVSATGASWAQPSDSTTMGFGRGIAANDVRVIATDFNNSPVRMDNLTTGVTSFTAGFGGFPNAVVWGNSEFMLAAAGVAAGPAQISWSTNGDNGTWNVVTLPAGALGDPTALVYGGGTYALFLDNSGSLTVWYSTDKTTWTQGTLPVITGVDYWDKALFVGDRFIATSANESSHNVALVYTLQSADGITWTQGTSLATPASATSNYADIAFDGCSIAALAHSGASINLYVTRDEANWGTATLLARNAVGLAFGTDYTFVSLSTPAFIIRSAA